MTRPDLKHGAVLLVAVTAAVVAVAAASGAFDSPSSSAATPTGAGGEPVAQPTAGVSAPSAAQVAAFPVLGEAATAADSVDTSQQVLSALGTAQAQYGADPSLGRVVLTSSQDTALIVPGREAVCLVVTRGAEDASALCEPEAAAESEGIGTVESAGSERFAVIGAFSTTAGASQLRAVGPSGAETPVEINPQNGYVVAGTVKPTALHWTGPNGSQHTRALFWPSLP